MIKSPYLTLCAAALLTVVSAFDLRADQKLELVTGKAFDSAIPRDFYLEGNAIPTAKRNAVLVHLGGGARAVFSLIDTTGYAADIIAKYVGMIITEGTVTICGQKVNVGSYGFGWARPASGVDQPGKFSLYDQAGKKIAECATPRDAKLQQARPLQIVVGQDGGGRLYYGRHYLEIR